MSVKSNLRNRINKLSSEERKILLKQTESLYRQCRLLNTDDLNGFDFSEENNSLIDINQVICFYIFIILNFFYRKLRVYL